MGKAISGTTKKKGRGRPKTTGKGVGVHVRMHEPELTLVDEWAAANGCTRADAIRQLVRLGLEGAPVRKR